MQTSTNHLVSRERLDEMDEALRATYTPVPERLAGAAQRALGGRKERYISKRSGGALSRWAAGQRAAARKRAKASDRRRKVEKATRKRQRRRQ